MRASISPWLPVSLLGALLAPGLAGCAKEVKAEFPRPPATATMPAPEEPEEIAPPPVTEEPLETEPAEPTPPADEKPEPPADPPAPPPRPRELPQEEEPVEPPSTNLADPVDVDPELASKLDRANSLLGSISQRNLTSEQIDQLVAARGFVVQARLALTEGDQRRALVLIDKGLILAEDVERLSRP